MVNDLALTSSSSASLAPFVQCVGLITSRGSSKFEGLSKLVARLNGRTGPGGYGASGLAGAERFLHAAPDREPRVNERSCGAADSCGIPSGPLWLNLGPRSGRTNLEPAANDSAPSGDASAGWSIGLTIGLP